MRTALKARLIHPALLLIATIGIVLAPCGGADGAVAPSAQEPRPASLAEPAASPSEPAADAFDIADAPSIPAIEHPPVRLQVPSDVPEELRIIWEAWAFLNSDYFDKTRLDNPEPFSEQAIRGMLQVLGDPQTAYVSPEVLAADFQDVFHGEFEGIGAHVNMNRAGKLIIVSPIPGSPAEAAGIRSGDIVLEVNGETVEGLSLLGAVAKIRGPKGSTVSLLVKHLTEPDPVLIDVRRGVIPLVSVSLRSKPDDRFAHIRITNFYPNTPDQLAETIGQVVDGGAEGLILDLRGNPGGPLDPTVEIASQFLTDGLVLYYLDGNGARRDWQVREGGIATEIPMVVLVNEFSASSSEVLTGALQDYERATIIGNTTFGKGSVNHLRPLSNGGGLYITIGQWFTPLGRLIQDEGIKPDIEVASRDAREADVLQLRRAIEELEQMTADEGPAKASS